MDRTPAFCFKSIRKLKCTQTRQKQIMHRTLGVSTFIRSQMKPWYKAIFSPLDMISIFLLYPREGGQISLSGSLSQGLSLRVSLSGSLSLSLRVSLSGSLSQGLSLRVSLSGSLSLGSLSGLSLSLSLSLSRNGK